MPDQKSNTFTGKGHCGFSQVDAMMKKGKLITRIQNQTSDDDYIYDKDHSTCKLTKDPAFLFVLPLHYKM